MFIRWEKTPSSIRGRPHSLVSEGVDINWNTVIDNLNPVMLSKGRPVHSIEPQIYQGAMQARKDGVDLMIIGDANDYIFGGMDKFLSKDWTFDAFVKWYIYVDPVEVLKEPINVYYVFEPYRKGNGIDFIKILEKLTTQESYDSYNNASGLLIILARKLSKQLYVITMLIYQRAVRL